jgi:hypothetical protein
VNTSGLAISGKTPRTQARNALAPIVVCRVHRALSVERCGRRR